MTDTRNTILDQVRAVLSLGNAVRRITGRQPPESAEAVAAGAAPLSGRDADQRLLELFKNRAELKKAFSGLNDECAQLREQLDEQKGLTGQERQKLQALEARLGDPSTSHAVILHYQLRALWAFCHDLLQSFVEELYAQQEGRERKQEELAFNQARQQRIAGLGSEIQSLQSQSEQLTGQLGALVGRREAMSGFWNYFRRRKLSEQVDPLREESERIRHHLEARIDQRSQIQAEAGPEFAGLSVEARRSINLAVMALAQYLYVEFSNHSLAMMSRLASIHTIAEVDYGAPHDCLLVTQRLEEAMERMQAKKGYADQLKARARYLRRRVSYKHPADTIAVPDSFESFPRTLQGEEPGLQIDVNVLVENYWDIVSVLVR